MKRAIAAIGVALFLSAAPLRLLAQTATWADGETENAVTFDSGQVQYRQSKPLPGNKSGWWDYTISLSDIDCLQFQALSTGDVLSIVGKSNDSVLKKADPYGTTRGYEAGLKHFDMIFPPSASATALDLLHELQRAAPNLLRRTNTGACAPMPLNY